jgi:hypothetical protein
MRSPSQRHLDHRQPIVIMLLHCLLNDIERIEVLVVPVFCTVGLGIARRRVIRLGMKWAETALGLKGKNGF